MSVFNRAEIAHRKDRLSRGSSVLVIGLLSAACWAAVVLIAWAIVRVL